MITPLVAIQWLSSTKSHDTRCGRPYRVTQLAPPSKVSTMVCPGTAPSDATQSTTRKALDPSSTCTEPYRGVVGIDGASVASTDGVVHVRPPSAVDRR